MQYRMDWLLAHALLGAERGDGLSIHPDTMQGLVLKAGTALHQRENSVSFMDEMNKIMDEGVSLIISLREGAT